MSKSKIPRADEQLDTTLIAWRKGTDGLPAGLKREERDLVIGKLIEQLGGSQCTATGTVVIGVPLDGLPTDIVVQLWIHDWED